MGVGYQEKIIRGWPLQGEKLQIESVINDDLINDVYIMKLR